MDERRNQHRTGRMAAAGVVATINFAATPALFGTLI
jgi:hypothetical protein